MKFAPLPYGHGFLLRKKRLLLLLYLLHLLSIRVQAKYFVHILLLENTI
jgi:hypothetical protein